jgi:hypothetical protein
MLVDPSITNALRVQGKRVVWAVVVDLSVVDIA